MNRPIVFAKSKVALSIFVLFLAACSALSQNDQPFSINNSPLPAPTGFVNDYAGVIDASTKSQLEQKIKAFKERSNPSTELAVAVVRTTGDRDIFDYSLAVARGWKIGSKADDNPSVLLFVAIDDRKYFTQVSKDLEDELPDGLVGSLQRQYLVPEFRKGNYGKGISDTIDAYIATIDAKRTGQPTPTPDDVGSVATGSGISGLACCIIIIIAVIFLIILSRAARGGRGGPTSTDRGRWGGGGGGFGGGSALPWIIGGIASSGSDWGSSSSGSDWGGSSGGSDWGGFGGGGDFGGGGAGGGW